MKQWTIIRDILLFVGGLAGVVHETIILSGTERPTLLILFAAMMGLPAFIRKDERLNGDSDKKPQETKRDTS